MARPVTRFLCRWVPRRSSARRFTKSDAARVCCYAITDGATLEEIFTAVKIRCPDNREEAQRRVAAEIALAGEVGLAVQIIQYLDAQNRFFFDPQLRQLLILLGILVAFGIAVGVAPVPAPLKAPVLVALRAAQTGLRTFEGSIIRQRAANDAFIELMREVLKKAA